MSAVIDTTITNRRRWGSVVAASVVMQFSYWFIVSEVVSAGVEGAESSAAPIALGLAVAPFVFLVLAFSSGHPRAPLAVLKAMGLFLVLGLSLGLLDVVLGLVTGFAAGGAVTLRARGDDPPVRARGVAVLTASLYVLLLLLLIPSFGVVTGAVLPLMVIAIADQLVDERRGTGTTP